MQTLIGFQYCCKNKISYTVYCTARFMSNKGVWFFQLPSNKLSDFLDPNLNRMMNQLEQLDGEEQENAIIEALRVTISIYNHLKGL